VHPFDVLGDPVRRRILDELTAGERTAGELAAAATAEFGITQPAVSRQLRILRDESFVAVRPDGTRRFYALAAEGLSAADSALAVYRPAWQQRLDALHTEVARGKRARAVDHNKEKAS
jgi:DNA-binding transcriptional ArsR family regulator